MPVLFFLQSIIMIQIIILEIIIILWYNIDVSSNPNYTR